MTTPAPKTELIDSVRHWVHFDNLAETLGKQVTNARQMRKTFEEKIIRTLDTSGMKSAVLQINGATLQRKTEFKARDLSWSLLEEQLHEFFKGKPRDDTNAIIEFIQSRRGGKTSEYIQKTLTADVPAKKGPGP